MTIHSPTYLFVSMKERYLKTIDLKINKCKECSRIYGKEIALHLEDYLAAFYKNARAVLKRKKKIIKFEQINSIKKMENGINFIFNCF